MASEAALISVIEPGRSCGPRSGSSSTRTAFLSPHGLRERLEALREQPVHARRAFQAPGSTTSPPSRRRAMFGGNSNWRGPVWMPVNYLAIRQFVLFQRLPRRRLQARVPDRLRAAAHLRRDRPGSRRPDRRDLAPGRRMAAGPSTAGSRSSRTDPAWKDNLLFNEYFHGDNGAGLGADAPDRLDGARGRPDPRPAVGRARTRTHVAVRRPAPHPRRSRHLARAAERSRGGLACVAGDVGVEGRE